MVDNKPFFSVIIPAHNSQAYIRKGLESIRQQRFTDYELIIVCDACTDDTELVAKAYTDKVIVTEYGLDGMARNAGEKKRAAAKHIAMVNAVRPVLPP